ncbi:WhiB family transcriptional regulator [Kitasatospora sp. NPDC059408]|uniref:WhiB family transcriptional regulator n=1 Tax=Kitasatospora sp. NPDC059408 TaxID=3346823 RepID=UPI00369F8C53
MSWRLLATCRIEKAPFGIFYPRSYRDAEGLAKIAAAKSYCHRCPVAEQCLTEALNDEGQADAKNRHGVRGDKTPGERAAINKKRRLAPAA